MFCKSITAATMAFALTSSPALAQAVQNPAHDEPGTPAVTGSVQGGDTVTRTPFASDDERVMFEDNLEMWSGFFTDDTRTTLRSEGEVRAQFSAMTDTDQASIREACQRALQDRGSYGTVTLGLCDQIGAI